MKPSDDGSSTSAATLAFLNEMSAEGRLATVESEDGDMATQTFIILNDSNDLNPASPSTITSSSPATITTETLQLGIARGVDSTTQNVGVQMGLQEHAVLPPKKPGRRSGRPKKGEEKNKPIVAVPATESKPEVPEKGADGTMRCSRCHRSFRKERHFKTHKCLATSAYVDITKRDVKLDSGDEEEPEEGEAGAIEEEEEYRVPEDAGHSGDESNEDEATVSKGSSKSFRQFQLHTDADAEAGAKERTTEGIEDVPIFRTEEEKMAFETTINVDLSCVDHMFKVHVIDQDVNEHAGTYGRSQVTSLSLYSCTVCEKVFKTLSHMRLHCLVHTDVKPFKCSKCQYATNSKGNLYTHMRKHTGQYYNCKHCDFRTVNKSHLVEHEATHDKTRHPCALCQRDYATSKSLINHVRKYHSNSRRGRQYLQSFLQGRQTRGSTVIHQCHVCMRKFKKRIDRDRHLFVHDIRDVGTVQQCELCDYSASRRVYLEKHYLKHRVLYCCAACPSKFLSTIRLLEHLQTAHTEAGQESSGCDDLFERSINCSLYLPEPDEQLPAMEKHFINLPPELSSSAMASTADTEEGNKEGGGDVSEKQGEDDGLGLSVVESVDSMLVKPEPMELESGTEGQASKFLQTPAENSEGGKEQGDGDGDPSPSVMLVKVSKSDATVVTESDETNQKAQSDVPLVPNPGMVDAGNEVDMEEEAEGGEKDDGMADADEGVVGESEEPVLDKEKEAGGKGQELIERMGYQPMNMQILQKMRETFGSEECEFCGRLFYTKQDYDPHMRTHTGDKPYRCNDCGFRTITKENMRRHVEREHENVKFPCKDCEFVASSRTKLWNHQLTHLGINGLECPHCTEKFDGMKRLRSHMVTAHPDTAKEELEKLTGYKHKTQGKMGRRSYKCPHCDRVFIRANSELQKHIWIHEGIKPFKCTLCTYACRSKNNLAAHMLRHSTHKPFACQECGKAYKSKTALRWHVRSHKDGKLFKCFKCPYEAQQRSHLKRHMETHDVVKRFVCQHCDYSSNTAGYMKIHYARAHKGLQYMPELMQTVPTEGGVQGTEARVFKCLSCDYLFGNLSDLKRHLKIRHHVQVQDIAGIEQMQMAEVEVLQCAEETSVGETAEIVEPASVLTPGVTQTVTSTELDEKTASAVTLLQQIIDMQQQGAFGQQEIKVLSEDGQMVAVNPETIIVQQAGHQVLVTNSEDGVEGAGQYVIQYVAPGDDPGADPSMEGVPMEIQTVDSVESVQVVQE
nr:hypothetical protein BaRGS_025169 [Batillaria attramentaria]